MITKCGSKFQGKFEKMFQVLSVKLKISVRVIDQRAHFKYSWTNSHKIARRVSMQCFAVLISTSLEVIHKEQMGKKEKINFQNMVNTITKRQTKL